MKHTSETPAPLSDSEINQTAELLARVPAGFLPFPIFRQVARLAVFSIVEVVPMRVNADGEVEVLLLKRGEDKQDWPELWPGILHTPGTVIRPTDELGSYAQAFRRILHDELHDVELAGEPMYIKNLLHENKRGTESAQVFMVEVIGEPQAGAFYSADHLPSNIMLSQLDFIPDAVKAFKRYKDISE
jgi:hypothetical protein